MGITIQNVLSHEWIGLKVTVEQNTDLRTTGLAGRVINETRNMLTIETDRRTLGIAKNHATFRVKLPTGESLLVNGNDLRRRPEDRIKKGLNRW